MNAPTSTNARRVQYPRSERWRPRDCYARFKSGLVIRRPPRTKGLQGFTACSTCGFASSPCRRGCRAVHAQKGPEGPFARLDPNDYGNASLVAVYGARSGGSTGRPGSNPCFVAGGCRIASHPFVCLGPGVGLPLPCRCAHAHTRIRTHRCVPHVRMGGEFTKETEMKSTAMHEPKRSFLARRLTNLTRWRRPRPDRRIGRSRRSPHHGTGSGQRVVVEFSGDAHRQRQDDLPPWDPVGLRDRIRWRAWVGDVEQREHLRRLVLLQVQQRGWGIGHPRQLDGVHQEWKFR